jgi:glycosyltransferase involved in cell wall biosynthesis
MRLAIVNYVWDRALRTPEDLLGRYTSLTGWAEALVAAGADPVIVCQRFPVKADMVHRGVTYRFRPDAGTPKPGLRFSKADPTHTSAVAARPDVVHVNSVLHPSLVRGLRAALPKKTAMVVQEHGGLDLGGLSLPRRIAIRRGLLAADVLLVSSRGQAGLWRSSGALPPGLETVDVMEASTTLAPMARDTARRLSGVDGSPALLWVGRLNANKDPLAVLRGFALFVGRVPSARLSMVYGATDLLADVQREIARTPALTSRVRLLGAVPHDALPAYYSAADFLVLGSHAEGSGYAAIEAMACGTPLVVTDIPSFRALTDNGRVGSLWKPGQPQAFADALVRMSTRPPSAERDLARRRFDAQFSWPAIGWRAAEVYRKAVAQRRTAV